MRLDKDVKLLVKRLNMVNGVYPISSCGGHENPKGSRCCHGSFWIIMEIKNNSFLVDLKKHLNTNGSLGAELKYNGLHETWGIEGFSWDIPGIETFVFEYLNATNEFKPKEEWERFRQIDGTVVIYDIRL